MRIHIVQKGDTLWKIAKKYNVDFELLKRLNSHLSDPNMLMPGMKIKVPTSYSPVKKQKEMPMKEAPIKEAPKKEIPQPPPPPPMKELPKESMEFLPPMPEKEIPIHPPMPPQMPMMPMPHHYPCGCPPVMPIPCQPIHWHGPQPHNQYMPPMGMMMDDDSSSFLAYPPPHMTGMQMQPSMKWQGYPHGSYGHQMPIVPHGHMQPYGGMMYREPPYYGQYWHSAPVAQAPMFSNVEDASDFRDGGEENQRDENEDQD